MTTSIPKRALAIGLYLTALHVAVPGGLSSTADAAVLEMTITGEVTSVTADPFGEFPDVSINDAVTWVLTYDTNVPDLNPAPERGQYNQNFFVNPVLAASVTISTGAGPLVFDVPLTMTLLVNNYPGGDSLQLITQNGGIFGDPRINFVQVSPAVLPFVSSGALSDDSFPDLFKNVGPVDLSLFSSHYSFLNYSQYDVSSGTNLAQGSLNASITSIVISSVPAPPVPILLISALAALSIRRSTDAYPRTRRTRYCLMRTQR